MCSLTPSVTLYGTTQVPTVRTITHSSLATVLGEPVISLLTIQTTECDNFGLNCGPQFKTSLVTVTPSVTTTVFSVETKTILATNVIPQQTLYYPCTFAPTSETKKHGGEAAKETEGNVDGASTFDGVFSQTPAPTSSTTTTSSATTTSVSSSPSAMISSLSSSGTGTLPASSGLGQSFYAPSSSATGSGSSSFASAQTGIADSSHNSTSKSSHGPAIAGGIAGGVVALLLLCIIATYCRRTRARRDDQVSSSTDNYWERRFRALEAEADGTILESKEVGSPDSESPPEQPTGGLGKKLRLTLDLQSKGMSNRPASTLSMISAFFAKPQPAPFQARSSRGPLNFSRPGFGNRRRASKVSGVSGGKSAKSKRGSMAPSGKSVATWLNFGGSQRGSPEVKTRDFGKDGEEDGEGERKAMEWIRPGDETHEDRRKRGRNVPLERVLNAADNGGYPTPRRWSGQHARAQSPVVASTAYSQTATRGASPATPSLLPTHNPTAEAPPLGRQLTPPKAVHKPNIKTKISQSSLAPSTSSLCTIVSSEPSISASRPATRQMIAPPIPSIDMDTVPPSAWTNIKPTLRSYSTTRETKGKTIPSLHLSREAITPSLWIDEDLYDQFQRSEGNMLYRQPSEHLQQSHFSPDSSIPTESAVMSIADDPYGGIAPTEADDSRTTSGLNSASTLATAGGSIDEAPTAWVSRAERGERSAVTPQLPIMTLGDDSRLGIDWSGEREERMVSIYQPERR